MTYSVAIRTLGSAGLKFQQELESLHQQTIAAERILVYIAEGYSRPDFQIGKEEYIWVKKGMVAQRALQYREIESDCILLLDDDVELAPDSVERMLKAMEENNADCVGADTFKNQELSLWSKFFAIFTNWVIPHFDQHWAFKIRSHGSFSYLNHPVRPFYWSQSCAGPCSIWKKEVFLAIHLEDELWMESLGFPYDEDSVSFYKLFVNGYRLGVIYNSGVQNLDGQSSSGGYHANIQKYYIRSKGIFLVWWRCCYCTQKSLMSRIAISVIFALKCLWLLMVNIFAIIPARSLNVPILYCKGLVDALSFVVSEEARKIPPYVLK